MAIYATPTHRLLATAKPAADTNVPGTTKEIPKPAATAIQSKGTPSINVTSTTKDISKPPKAAASPEVARPATRRPPIPATTRLREELPSTDSRDAPTLPPRNPDRPKTMAGKARCAVSWALNTLRDGSKPQQEIKNVITDPRKY